MTILSVSERIRRAIEDVVKAGSVDDYDCNWAQLAIDYLDELYGHTSNTAIPSPRAPEGPRQSSRLAEIQAQGDDRFEALMGDLLGEIKNLPSAAQRAQELPPAQVADYLRTLQVQARRLGFLFFSKVIQNPEEVLEIQPDHPVGILDTANGANDWQSWFKQGRLYLDVTDAKLDDVKDRWALIEWHQENLRQRGLTAKRQRGTPRGPRKGGKVERWVNRAREIGEDPARSELKAEVGCAPGEWEHHSKWWRDIVRPHLRKAADL